MNLTSRRKLILLQLIQIEDFHAIDILAQRHNVSRRTIQYDLDQIDDFLTYRKTPKLIRQSTLGVRFVSDEKYRVDTLNFLSKLDNYTYVMSAVERVYAILNLLILRDKFITIADIADRLLISRSTVINSLTEVKEWLHKHSLNLESIPNHGLRLAGSEINLRRAASKLYMSRIDTSTVLESLKDPNNELDPICVDFHNRIKDADVEFIETYVKDLEQYLETIFSDSFYSELVVSIAVALHRIKVQKQIAEEEIDLDSIANARAFVAVKSLANRLEKHFQVSIPDTETGYLASLVLSGKVSSAKVNETQIEIQILVCSMIEDVGQQLALDLSGDQQLFDGLMEHLRPTIYRLRQGITQINPLKKEIKNSYASLFSTVQKAAKIIENYLGKILSDDEIGYFTLHFCAAMERLVAKRIGKLNVLVVCGAGVGTAKLLSSRLQTEFKVNIAGVVAKHQVENFLQHSMVDLVVTTVPINLGQLPCVQVNALLTDQDVEKLKPYLARSGSVDVTLEKLISIIENHCNVVDLNGLVRDLTGILGATDESSAVLDTRPKLRDLLTKDTILLDVQASDWEAAIRIAGGVLYQGGYIQEHYTESMLDAVKKMGPYIVIGKGIALPHAQTAVDVCKTGMCFIRLSPPVVFGNPDNDPVDLMFCFAATDASFHLPALFELSRLICSESHLRVFRKAKSAIEIISMVSETE